MNAYPRPLSDPKPTRPTGVRAPVTARGRQIADRSRTARIERALMGTIGRPFV